MTCAGERKQFAGRVKGRGGIYLVAGRTVAQQPQQQLWLSQHPQGGPEWRCSCFGFVRARGSAAGHRRRTWSCRGCCGISLKASSAGLKGDQTRQMNSITALNVVFFLLHGGKYMEFNYRRQKMIRLFISIVAARVSMATDWPHYGFWKIGNLLKMMRHDWGLGNNCVNMMIPLAGSGKIPWLLLLMTEFLGESWLPSPCPGAWPGPKLCPGPKLDM